MTESSVELMIESVGAKGDGIAQWQGRSVYVPYTAIGDRVAARVDGDRATIVEILEPGMGRQPPRCRHFGLCGGCALQHLDREAYHRWIESRIGSALARHGIEHPVLAPVVEVSPGSRRRVDLEAVRAGPGVQLGFSRRHSNHVVDVLECAVVEPGILAMLDPLRIVLSKIMSPRQRAAILVTHTDSGNDLLISAGWPLDLAATETLAGFAHDFDFARIAWRFDDRIETVISLRPPRITAGRYTVAIPPGAFLQPTVEGEEKLVSLIAASLSDAQRIADLYAGCGTFSVPLVRQGSVTSFEIDENAVAAIAKVADAHELGERLTARCRDLHRNPLTAIELESFDAVIFDPPRAGARAQAKEIAESSVSTVVAVSCNPETFARDARLLLHGGYRLLMVTPVDQFHWSAHIELVASFEKSRNGARTKASA
ncbi:MAG: class I SAM-dependent RNA methyltransferase [Alphaproteobacteria bacterium]|nr:class I SAM-dependent RNA methyltransferase [Alphaproteobacteria bacterium]